MDVWKMPGHDRERKFDTPFPAIMNMPVLVTGKGGNETVEDRTFIQADRFAMAMMAAKDDKAQPPYVIIQQGFGESGLFTAMDHESVAKLRDSLNRILAILDSGQSTLALVEEQGYKVGETDVEES